MFSNNKKEVICGVTLKHPCLWILTKIQLLLMIFQGINDLVNSYPITKYSLMVSLLQLLQWVILG